MNPIFKVCGVSPVYMGRASELLRELLPEGRVVVVADERVARLYPSLVADYKTIAVPAGESFKNLETILTLCRRFIEAGVDRSTFILGIGGGIATDMAGFAASIYMRGLKFGFVSTTLLGQVDASVGGKNGVNVDGYKNMAGTFTQPQFVICDTEMLSTLPDREFRAGLAEVVKTAVMADRGLFERLEQTDFATLRSDRRLLEEVIRTSVAIKAGIVGRDEREAGERRKLNLGHTLAHALEKSTQRFNHGEAVAIGLRLVADAAVTAGLMPCEDRDRLAALLRKLGFDLELPVSMPTLLAAAAKDKKNKDGVLRVVFPLSIGACEVREITAEDFGRLF